MSKRPARPLDPAAVKAADAAIYSAHAGDPRPNPLYDAAGNKQPLDPKDSSQAALRSEWMDSYEANGGKMNPPSGSSGKTPVAAPVAPCPKEATATLKVTALYNVIPNPVKFVDVTITGPVTATQTADATGSTVFTGLPPGTYQITTKYTQKNTIVDNAKKHVSSTDWAYVADRPPYLPPDTNKCNGFVYEVLTASGETVPLKTRFSYRRMSDVSYPPLAGHWASSTGSLGTSVVVTDPEPGDVIAQAKQYSDATGHVGIISYPKDGSGSRTLAEGENAEETVEMKRLTISAAESEVVENGWGWRDSQAGDSFTYRRFP
ncbi:hypothetical protein OVA24_10665 [Luteolibacter sp. SL250]|uniref:hypothetical protein n=1 Tax=Luteolibacter sp. SL250 TaxID=2995170 RepID=UPI002271C386|nr:hypothetical protein [Luteolibacter sp. SL250]WAC21845.1 hypothetical protein OVA24_10665 [Luteolibacter sp. SL250]